MVEFGKSSTAEEVALALAGSIRGKNVLITGVSPGGLGAETARAIALSNPKSLVLAGRNVAKIRQTEASINRESTTIPTKVLELDLSVQRQVRKAAEEVNRYEGPVDCLINNAGIMAAPFSLTSDGIESQFATNHVGHFLFTNLIMPKLLAAEHGGRVVNVSSAGHKRERIRFDDYNFQNGEAYDKWKAYGQSKTANMLFSVALADKLGRRQLRSYSLYPGRIFTNIAQQVSMEELKALGWLDDSGKPVPNPALRWKTVASGSATTVVAAFDPSINEHNGAYLEDCAVRNEAAAEYALDHTEAERLWALSEELVGQKFSY